MSPPPDDSQDNTTTADTEFVSSSALSQLPYQQLVLFVEIWQQYLAYLRTEGKNPKRHVGYSRSNIRPIARRTLQVFQFIWDTELRLELTTDDANQFVNELNSDHITKNNGESYSEGSKRKFVDALSAYFRFADINWTPPVSFGASANALSSDPLTKKERERLLTAACEYGSPPNYKSVTPEERDRWNAKIAQRIGIPKSEIGPADSVDHIGLE